MSSPNLLSFLTRPIPARNAHSLSNRSVVQYVYPPRSQFLCTDPSTAPFCRLSFEALQPPRCHLFYLFLVHRPYQISRCPGNRPLRARGFQQLHCLWGSCAEVPAYRQSSSVRNRGSILLTTLQSDPKEKSKCVNDVCQKHGRECFGCKMCPHREATSKREVDVPCSKCDWKQTCASVGSSVFIQSRG